MSALAELALTMVAGEQFSPSTPEFERTVRALCESLVQPDEARHRAQIDQLLRSGVSVDEVLGLYIPAAARLLGTDWVEDRLNWAAVTIGSAHLQRQVRRLSAHPLRDAPATETGQTVLLVTLEGDQHTLGACLAADGMRQAGLRVQMAMGLSAEEVAAIATARPLSMIGLSLGSAKMQPEAERLVAMLHGSMKERCPIVVGGAVASPDVNVKSLVGVDLITSDMSEALEFCGLPTMSEMSSDPTKPLQSKAAPTRGRPV
ncbi:cobalamin B12-binding domain-containing protein [Pontivivens ytuae]|uniref:Cobalamin B12-binding domain-containing protein n=1 Tax=Pontivivens ytuae TaxID=2789856 RepID=A0A7S9LQN0_9RHOB|nr:cobalamin B12-binding domain-containing protein [Pontivivens ytuae]QPH53442.1 cobalamin B12-binding domain-containing protein [Pontivivens ytuae]